MRQIYSIATTAALIAALAACNHKATPTVEEMTVDVAPVETDSVTLFRTYPGTLKASSSADVVCRVNGTIASQHYEGGAQVRRGDVLFTIATNTYTDALAEAEASLDKAISANQYAESHYEAVQRAAPSNAVSQMEVAQALSDRDQSRAAIATARAVVDQARSNVEKCTIRAPFDGRVSSGIYSAGAYVAGEASPVTLARIYDDATVDANFYIEDASFLRMFEHANNRHLIDYDSVPIQFQERLPHAYTGRMYYISPNVDTSTGSLLLKCRLHNRWNELRDGMYATVSLPYKVEPQAMLVRDASLGTDQLGRYLYVVNDSNRVVYTPVEVGDLVGDTMRVVLSGVRPGDRYVTSALLKMRDGLTVRPRIVK